MAPPRFRHIGRCSQRGAAMVEAAAVAPVIVLFYGLLVFVYNEYDEKQSLMAISRYQSVRGSVHQCQSTEPGAEASGKVPLESLDSAVRSPYVLRSLEIAKMTNFVEARGMKSTAKNTGTATNAPLSQLLRERALTAESEVYCVPLGLGENSDYTKLAIRTTKTLVDDVIGPVLAILKAIFNKGVQ